MKDVSFKSFAFKAEDLQENGMIRGLASTFGNVDYGLDVVDKGAFKKSIQESKGKWPILADHDPSKQVGWNMRAEETSEGLYVEGKLDLNVQTARERYSLAKTAIEQGAKMGLSIGYTTIKWENDRDNSNIRRLKELKMWEYSLVTFPMNPEAQITQAKSNTERVELWLAQAKDFGVSTDEIKEALLQKQEGVLNDGDADDIIAKIQQTQKLLKAAAPNDPAQLSQSFEQMISMFKK